MIWPRIKLPSLSSKATLPQQWIKSSQPTADSKANTELQLKVRQLQTEKDALADELATVNERSKTLADSLASEKKRNQHQAINIATATDEIKHNAFELAIARATADSKTKENTELQTETNWLHIRLSLSQPKPGKRETQAKQTTLDELKDEHQSVLAYKEKDHQTTVKDLNRRVAELKATIMSKEKALHELHTALANLKVNQQMALESKGKELAYWNGHGAATFAINKRLVNQAANQSVVPMAAKQPAIPTAADPTATFQLDPDHTNTTANDDDLLLLQQKKSDGDSEVEEKAVASSYSGSRFNRSSLKPPVVKIENPLKGLVRCPPPNCTFNQFGVRASVRGCNVVTCQCHQAYF
eukprot:scaffold8828_cov204-Amphora_coffeaeformis.AAC.42